MSKVDLIDGNSSYIYITINCGKYRKLVRNGGKITLLANTYSRNLTRTCILKLNLYKISISILSIFYLK